MITLYDYFRSSAAFRARIALEYKGLPYKKVTIDLRTGAQKNDEYTKLNPEGLVPLLDDNNALISQSLAIIEYLEEKHPTNPLLPKDILARAYVRSIALNISSDIHPLNNLRIRNYLTNTLECSKNEGNEWYNHWLTIGLDGLEKQIKNSKFFTGKYCYNDQFSIADVCIVPQLFNLRRFMSDNGAENQAIDMLMAKQYPTLSMIEKNCIELNAVQSAWPKE